MGWPGEMDANDVYPAYCGMQAFHTAPRAIAIAASAIALVGLLLKVDHRHQFIARISLHTLHSASGGTAPLMSLHVLRPKPLQDIRMPWKRCSGGAKTLGECV